VPLDVGQLLRGYHILDFVQQGGFGSIYRAHQNSVQRDVAIKSIDNQRIVKNIDFIRRFEIEAQIIARLEHPHIVPIHDFWREPDSAFIVMRWLSGGSIRTDVSQNYDVSTLISMLTQIGSALDFVHRHNIIHRDIKPDNILLDDNNNFYLTDFGIAIESQRKASIDPEFMRLGTPEYMPPELILEDEVTHKSDIYAFAIATYEILTGRPPFTGDTIDNILMQQINSTFPSVSKYRTDLPEELDIPLLRASSKLPEDRHEHIMEFVHELVAVLREVPDATFTAASNVVATQQFQTIDFGQQLTDTVQFSDEPLVINRNPYKGLNAFSELDANDFYGRSAVIQQMLERLENQHEHDEPAFLTVIGASGSGKSSIVRAGLIPRLRSGVINDSGTWLYITMTPGTTPIQTLAQQLNSIAFESQDNFINALQNDPDGSSEMIRQMVGGIPIFLLIDQFEEVFTQVTDSQEQAQFIELLVQLSKSTLNITIVVTLRADFYDKPLAYRELGELIQRNTVTILPMSPTNLADVITEPAQSVGCTVESGLVTQLIADTIDQPNALPLLQFAITELFEQRTGQTLLLQSYENMGRLQGAVVQSAESVYVTLSKAEQRIAERLFLQLIILSESNDAIRRRILWENAINIDTLETVKPVINKFGDSRLLSFDRDPISRQPTIEVAHEALLGTWTRLQLWIAENRNTLTMYRRLNISIQNWLENDYNNSFLARDVQLIQYENILGNPVIVLNQDDRHYIQASQQLRQRSRRLRYGAVIGLIVLTIASIIVSAIAIDQQNQAQVARQDALEERDRANTQSERSQSQALAATALNVRANGRQALILAAQAVTTADTFEARDSLANVLADHRLINMYFSQDIPIRDIAVTSDKKFAYTVGDSNQVIRWDIEQKSHQEFATIDSLSVLNTVASHPDDMYLAVGGQSGYAILDRISGNLIHSDTRDDEVWALVWNNSGMILYGADRAGNVFAFDLENDALLFDVLISENPLLAITYQPVNDTLFVAGENSIIYGISASSGEPLYEFEGHTNWVLSLDISPDGTLLASAGADLNLIVWDMINLQAIGQIPTRHSDWIRQVSFDSDGDQMLTASADGTIQRWDVATGRRIDAPFTRHTAPIWAVAQLSDNHFLSTDRNGILIDWALDNLPYPLIALDSLGSNIIASQPLETKVIIVTQPSESDTMLQVLDLQTGGLEEIRPLNGFVTDITYTDATEFVAIALIDQTIQLSNRDTLSDSMTLHGHNSIILDMAFAPDGQTLLSVDEEGAILQWDVASNTLQQTHILPVDESIAIITYLNRDQILSIDRTGLMRLHQAETLEVTQVITGGHDGVVTRVLHDNGRLYTVGYDALVIEWDTDTWQNTHFPQAHSDWILDIIKIDDVLVTTGRDSSVVVWDIDRRQPIGQPLTTPSSDWGIALFSDGTRVYSLLRDGTMGLWELSVDAWVQHACTVANMTSVPDDIEHLFANTFACQ